MRTSLRSRLINSAAGLTGIALALYNFDKLSEKDRLYLFAIAAATMVIYQGTDLAGEALRDRLRAPLYNCLMRCCRATGALEEDVNSDDERIRNRRPG